MKNAITAGLGCINLIALIVAKISPQNSRAYKIAFEFILVSSGFLVGWAIE